MRGSSLGADVAAAQKRWLDQPTEANQERFIALCAAQSRWRSGDDELAEDELGQDESGPA